MQARQLPRSLSDDGNALVCVELVEIRLGHGEPVVDSKQRPASGKYPGVAGRDGAARGDGSWSSGRSRRAPMLVARSTAADEPVPDWAI